MTTLALPSPDLFDSWAATVTDFGGAHLAGAGIPDTEASDASRDACLRLVAKAARDRDLSVPPGEGRVHQTLFWITDDDGDVVGFLGLRHALTTFLENVGGHIGYSVRPAARRRGHASAALRLALGEAAALGIDTALVTCDDDNVASARTIESTGGVLRDVVDGTPWGYGRVRRYGIPTGQR